MMLQIYQGILEVVFQGLKGLDCLRPSNLAGEFRWEIIEVVAMHFRISSSLD